MSVLTCDSPDLADRKPPALYGFTHQSGEWRLNLSYYERFIEEVTGVEIEDNLSPQKIKTIQSRIEGCVASYQRSGRCICDNLSKYEYVDSMGTVRELSRFFRIWVSTYIEGSLSS